MPTLTRSFSERLSEVTGQAREQRAEAKQAWMRFEQAKERLANDDSDAALRAAEAAQSEYDRLSADLREAEGKRDALFSMEYDGKRSARPHHFGDESAPGEWLSRIIQKHALTTADIGSTEDLGRVFFDRLREASALMASKPTVIDIGASSIKIPTLIDRLAPASIVPELDPIPEVTVPLELVEVQPPKLAQLTTLSKEAFNDARPALLAANERELIGSIGAGFDLGAFHGAAASAQPGLEHTAGVLVVDAAGTLTNLDPFVRGISALRRARTIATAIYCNPATWERLALLKKATESNEPLVSGQLAATDLPAETILGIPVYQSEVIEPALAFVANARELVVVRRSEVELDIDPYFKFDLAAYGVRVIARAKLVPAQAKAVCLIENLPTA